MVIWQIALEGIGTRLESQVKLGLPFIIIICVTKSASISSSEKWT